MLKQYEEIAVLEQGDDGAVVSICGQGGPSVLLGPGYLGHLQRVVHHAGEHLKALPNAGSGSPVRLLLLEMTTLLKTYDETCNKYLGSVSGPKSTAQSLEELDELRKEFEELISKM